MNAPQTILLKLGGEALGPSQGAGVDPRAVARLASEIAEVRRRGVDVGVVVGGGNLWRGREVTFLDRVSADQVGMLATALNGLVLRAALERQGAQSVVQSAIALAFADPLDPQRARAALGAGKVVIFIGGTGNPLVSTDTAAAIRAVEIGAQRLLKATTVDGVYDRDPDRHPDAQRFDALSFDEALKQRYRVMDLAAFELCQRHGVPILVFDVRPRGSLVRALDDPSVGTLIS